MKEDGAALGKRVKISKAQQYTLLAVLGASLALGVCGVLTAHFLQNIAFNGKVIAAKGESEAKYEKLIKNVGVCEDTNNDGRFAGKELENCMPNSVSLEKIKGSLRYKIMEEMSTNGALESVGRANSGDSNCYDKNGKKIDYKKKYNTTVDENERNYAVKMMQICSALRVIPDALPSNVNEEALLASLNKIFILSNWDPETISPGGTAKVDEKNGLGVIPVNLSIEADTAKAFRVLNNMEKSIRTFDVTTANIEWSGKDGFTLNAQANSYYVEPMTLKEEIKTVYANEKKAKGSKTR